MWAPVDARRLLSVRLTGLDCREGMKLDGTGIRGEDEYEWNGIERRE